MFLSTQKIIAYLLLIFSISANALNNPPDALFDYQESPRSNLGLFPQWLSVLERPTREMAPEGQCDEKIRKVNAYAIARQSTGQGEVRNAVIELSIAGGEHDYHVASNQSDWKNWQTVQVSD